MRAREDFVVILFFMALGVCLGYCSDTLGWNRARVRHNQIQQPDTNTRIRASNLDLQPKQVISKDTIEMHHTDTVYKTIDTHAIIKAWYTTIVYNRSFSDSDFLATLNDTVKNSILLPGNLKVKLKQQILEHTITRYETLPAKRAFVAGAGIINMNNITGVPILFGYQSKSGMSITGGPIIGTKGFSINILTPIKSK